MRKARVRARQALIDDEMEELDEDHRERMNEVVRSSVRMQGPSILQMLESDLEQAWRKYMAYDGVERSTKGVMLRGRIRGLAQAIATIRSPYSRQDAGATSSAWAQVIKETEKESLRKVKGK